MELGLGIALLGLVIISLLFRREIVTNKKIMNGLIDDHFKSIVAFKEICRKIGANRCIYDYDIDKTGDRETVVEILEEAHYLHNEKFMIWIRDGYDERGGFTGRFEDER